MGKELEQMLKRKEEILAGDAARVKAQHDAGKLTARERIDKLLARSLPSWISLRPAASRA